MSNPTSNFGWQMPTSTDLVTDLPADFEVFGQAVDTSLADLKGGTTGQVLKKNSNTDMDFVWSADSAGMTNPMTTTGDTIYSSSGSTPARLGIGSSGQVLTVSGGVPTWATPAGGGKALSQIASGTLSGTSVTLSSLSSYDNLVLTIYNATWNTGSNELVLLLNNDSSSLYREEGGFVSGYGTTFGGTGRVNSDQYGILPFDSSSYNTDGDNCFMITFFNCSSSSGYTNWINTGATTNSASTRRIVNHQGVYKNNATISSIVIKTMNNYTFSGGTYVLWGA